MSTNVNGTNGKIIDVKTVSAGRNHLRVADQNLCGVSGRKTWALVTLDVPEFDVARTIVEVDAAIRDSHAVTVATHRSKAGGFPRRYSLIARIPSPDTIPTYLGKRIEPRIENQKLDRDAYIDPYFRLASAVAAIGVPPEDLGGMLMDLAIAFDASTRAEHRET